MDKLEEKAIERVEELLKDDIFECVVVSDAERCYIEGYKDPFGYTTINKNFLDNHFL